MLRNLSNFAIITVLALGTIGKSDVTIVKGDQNDETVKSTFASVDFSDRGLLISIYEDTDGRAKSAAALITPEYARSKSIDLFSLGKSIKKNEVDVWIKRDAEIKPVGVVINFK